MPHIVDWNQDSRKDVLCGNTGGTIYLLINEGTNADPLFNSQSEIMDGGEKLKVFYTSAPTVVDWNRDGKKDLLVGDAYGNIHYFENQGTEENPLFDGSSPLKVDGEIIDIGWGARPDVADWDGDGIMDLLCGVEGTGKVVYFKAIGPLSLSDNRIYGSTGGGIDFALNAGVANADRAYIILGSLSGTMPGMILPGGQVILPINWDGYTSFMLGLLNSSFFQNFLGALNAGGEASARFDTLVPVPEAVGLTMSYAFALNSPWNYASNGANIEIVP
jgi:hypothetical protein